MFAQAITETVCRRSELPKLHRLSPSITTPMTLPVWGAILDDVWVHRSSESDDANRNAACWLGRVDHEWSQIGVTSHPAKKVNDAFNTEIQGAYVNSEEHTLSLSPTKTVELMGACFWLLTLWQPNRHSLARAVGKLGFCHCFRPPLRASFGIMYQFLEDEREARRVRGMLPEAVWLELVEAAVLCPLAVMELSAPWARTIHTTDAAGTGGHGLAYSYADKDLVQAWSQSCSWRGGYSHLQHERGSDPCPLVIADLPLHKRFWHEVSRPGGRSHINLEEFDAQNWSLERRLLSFGQIGARCLEGGDSAVAVSAAIKGRSSSWLVHRRCRTQMALCLAGGLIPMRFYMRSALNPADRPSRRAPLVSVRAPLRPPGAPCVVVHLFSGPARDGDLEHHLMRLAKINHCWVHVISLDICKDPAHDLLNDELFSQIREWCYNGKVFGLVAGYPCNTVSRARYRPGGPPPLRLEK